jgi:molybdopterin/thiamine biosynthesis adenylyltransferase
VTEYRLTMDSMLFGSLLDAVLGGKETRVPLYAWGNALFPGNPHLQSFMEGHPGLLVRRECRIRPADRVEFETEGMGPGREEERDRGLIDWTVFPESSRETAFRLSSRFSVEAAGQFLSDLVRSPGFRIPGGELAGIRMARKEGFLSVNGREPEQPDSDIHGRTILWTGLKGFAGIREASIGCIGAGGLSNPFLLSAMHHGFRRFTIVDDDRLDAANLNRFTGGRREQVGAFKTDLLKRMILDFEPEAEVETLAEKFPYGGTEQALSACDILVCGVDNDFTRLNAQLYALAFSLPLFDMGSGIFLADNASLDPEVEEAGGQVRVFVPSGACLACMGLDAAAVADFSRRDLDRARGYVIGTDLTPPSVITLNTAVASFCLKLAVDYLAGRPLPSFHLKYSEKDLSLYKVAVKKDPSCVVCGESRAIAGAHGAGTP